MATRIVGPRVATLIRDDAGYREYKLKTLIEGDPATDGPLTVLYTPGLYLPGSPWQILNEFDLWVWCRPGAQVIPHEHREGEPVQWWTVEQTFSNKPPDSNRQRCQDVPIEDPLLEPAKISGSFVKYTEEATRDRFGRPIVNSAFEQVRGPQNEWDANRDTLKIVQNVPSSFQAITLPALLKDCVNDLPLWGLPARAVKLSARSFDRQFHGQCEVYYQRTLDFDIFVKTDETTGLTVGAFDRDLLDEGTKVLRGYWDTEAASPTYRRWVVAAGVSASNPGDFIRFKDFNGENTTVVLDGTGRPITTAIQGGITDATNASPIVITSSGHGLTDGSIVAISGVLGNTKANGRWAVTFIDANTFSLDGSTGNAAYTSGGNWQNVGSSGPGKIHVEKYPSANLTLLGIPLIF